MLQKFMLSLAAIAAASGTAHAIQELPYLVQEGDVPAKVAVAPQLNPDAGYKESIRGLVPGNFDVMIHQSVTMPPRIHVQPGVAWTSALQALAEEYRFSAQVDWDAQRVFIRPIEVIARPAVPGARSMAWVERTSGYSEGSAGPLLPVALGPEEFHTLNRPNENRARWVWTVTAGESGRDSLERTLAAYGWGTRFAKGVPRLEARSDQRFEGDTLVDLLGRVLPQLGLTFDVYYKDRVVEIRPADVQ